MPYLTECVIIAIKCMVGFFIIGCVFAFFGLLAQGIWALFHGEVYKSTWAWGNLEQESFTKPDVWDAADEKLGKKTERGLPDFPKGKDIYFTEEIIKLGPEYSGGRHYREPDSHQEKFVEDCQTEDEIIELTDDMADEALAFELAKDNEQIPEYDPVADPTYHEDNPDLKE